MPTDTRRITGPEESVSPLAYVPPLSIFKSGSVCLFYDNMHAQINLESVHSVTDKNFFGILISTILHSAQGKGKTHRDLLLLNSMPRSKSLFFS